ncbi:hypothetical protein K7432_007870 [Basidiobolus ranarum]|uniref:Uncharacterized protein n=1 Tax=Basidiobolus ranarum TaxID=34480 RepID=A0ABR2WSQ4_9FUNG
MEFKIIEFAQKGDLEQLKEFLQTQDEEAPLEIIRKKLSSLDKENDIVELLILLRAIFHGSPVEEESGLTRRGQILLLILQWLCSEEIMNSSSSSERFITDLINFLIPETDELSSNIIVDGTTIIMDYLRQGGNISGKVFDFIPKFLQLLAPQEEVTVKEHTGETTVLSGQSFKDFLLDRICSYRWNADIVIHIASIFRDITMTPKQTEFVVNKIIRQFDSVDINEIPPLVYQLLVLSKKGCKRLIIEGITYYFNQLDRKHTSVENDRNLSFAQLSHMEGTVILHICFAIKQDQDLGSEFLKFVKSGKTRFLTVFNISCLLSIARIHRFEDATIDFLKSTVLTVFRDAEKLEQIQWMSEYSDFIYVPILKIFQSIVAKTAYGWDQATQSLVQLCMIIIDSTSSFGFKTAGRPYVKKVTNLSPNDHACDLAIEVLKELFKLHDMVRTEILDQILARVVAKANSVGSFLNLLDIIVKECPQTLTNYISRIKEALDYLSYLSFPAAEHLLKGLKPIVMMNSSFRDSLMLVLRKGMFSRDSEGRQIALAGFIELLTEESVKPSNSKTVHSDPLGLEILGMLRRCFSQQPEIRLRLYEALIEIMNTRMDLVPPILEILYPQFQKYYELDTNISTAVKLECCVENGSSGGLPRVIEPLPWLIKCLARSLILVEKSADYLDQAFSAHYSVAKSTFISIIQRLTRADMEDFELDKSADYSLTTNVGTRNNIFATLLLGVYEAVIEYCFLSEGDTIESATTIIELFKKYYSLSDMIKSKTTATRGRQSVAQASESSTLSFDFLTKACIHMFSKDEDSNQQAVTILRNETNFLKHVLNNLHGTLAKISSSSTSHNSFTIKYIKLLAPVFLEQIAEGISGNHDDESSESSGKRERGKSFLTIFIESYCSILQAAVSFYPDHVEAFLLSSSRFVAEVGPSESRLQDLVEGHLTTCKEYIDALITERIPLYKEATSLMNCVSILVKICSSHSVTTNMTAMIDWLSKICMEHAIEDTSFAKATVALLISLSKNVSNFKNALQFAEDIHIALGDIVPPEEDVEETSEQHFAIINSKTWNTTSTIVLSSVEQVLDELEWCLSHLRLNCSLQESHELSLQLSGLEKQISRHLAVHLEVIVEFEKACIIGPPAEQLLRAVNKVYKVLTILTKYKIVGSRMIEKEFINLVEIVGGPLSRYLYMLIPWLQQTDAENAEENRNKKKKGAKRNTKQKVA